MVRDLFLWFEVKCVQNDNGIIQTTQGYLSASHFCSWYPTHICIISFLAIENARKLLKWLYKLIEQEYSLFLSQYNMNTELCVRDRPLFPGVWRSVCVLGGSAFRTASLSELMGTMSSIFLSGNHLHNGKVVWVGANRCSGMRIISGVEEHNQIKARLRCKEIFSCSTFLFSLSPALFISWTIWEAASWGHLVTQVFISFRFTGNIQEK